MERKWILIVDDEVDIRENIAEQLTTHSPHFRVITAANGSEAQHKINHQKFDCIITDLSMPKCDGAAFIRSVKTSENNSSTPIIIVTSFPDDKLLQIYEYVWMLQKPVVNNVLIENVTRQVALGPTHKRLPVQLVNNVVHNLKVVLTNLNSQPQAQAPTMLNKTPMHGEHFFTFQVKYKNNSVFSFVVGFENANLHPDQIMTTLSKTLVSKWETPNEIEVINQIYFTREMVKDTCLSGYKGLFFNIATSGYGNISVYGIIGQEFILTYKNQKAVPLAA